MLFKKKHSEVAQADFGLLGVDMHSHLLPGIDDGSPNIETSVQLIKELKALGYRKLITTPHIMWDIYKNTNDIISDKLAIVKQRLREENIDIEIEAAAEYFIDDYFEQLLEQKKPLLSFGNKLVLVEFSMASAPFDLKRAIFEMQIQGYQPVVAHPERYVYAENNKPFFEELRDAGCLFQLNILSLAGYYGRSVAELGNYLLKKQYYELLGTDLHHFKHLESLRDPSIASFLKKMAETGRLLNPSL